MTQYYLDGLDKYGDPLANGVYLYKVDALINETKLGLDVIRSGETAAGAKRFASGKGRHGSFEDI